ncbi:MAG: SRPBCC family protein [Chloroherpetonaceae bacterium]|nr:SRPBCC family protein [Chloroherpetonaceae bacterium]
MPKYRASIDIQSTPEKVFHFHDDTSNLLRITPPDTRVELVSATPAGKGQRVKLSVTQFGFLKNTWEVEITTYEPPRKMIDEQLHGPFHKWVQTRTVMDLGNGLTRLTDEVEYELPMHAIGDFFAGRFVAAEISKMFEYRQRKTKEILEN